MREIVLDTETTGLDPVDGHRIIEIGCVELLDHLPTGVTLQHYVNPERLVSDYLICVGTLARLVKDEAIRSRLLNAATPREFIDALIAEAL